MKRFFTRHMSLRKRGHYKLLSCSDTQLHLGRKFHEEEAAAAAAIARGASVHEDLKSSLHVSQREGSVRRRRWYSITRRKKRRESQTTLSSDAEGAPEAHENFEVATEASAVHDVDASVCDASSHATLTRSVSTSTLDTRLDVQNPGFEVEHFAQVHTVETREVVPAPMKGRTQRRFAICEELEREIIMDNGVNLRKSRKNLVIRQVLHDLLLL